MLKMESKISFFPENKTRKHNSQSSWKRTAIAEIEGDIHLYYAWVLENRFNLKLNKPLRGAHVTFISDIVNSKIYEEVASIFDGRIMSFEYNPAEIRTNGSHWWLKVYSTDAENLRVACGLDPKPFFNFHLTIGHANEKNIEHSKYILDCIKMFNL
jgi:hypothetical protein